MFDHDESLPADETMPPSNGGGTSLPQKITQTIYLTNQVVSWYKTIKAWREGRNSYYISISSEDPFFYDVQKWLLQNINVDDQHSLTLTLREDERDNYSYRLFKAYDSDAESQPIFVDGHRILVTMEKPSSGADLLRSELSGNRSARSTIDVPRLRFICRSADAKDALLAELIHVQEETHARSRKPRLHLLNSWNPHGSTELPDRPIESVVLGEGQIERIVADMDRFLKSERDYVAKGIPWHRGYLFHGKPGTGKSSLAKALASHFGLDLYYYPIGAVTNDLELTKVVNQVREKAILLLEDVDVFAGFKEREGVEQKENTFSLSGFLNILDGVMTPHGLITVLTTNKREELDDAILRPGRVDMDEELALLTGDQADRMFAAFYGFPPSAPLAIEGSSPSVVMEAMKTHMYDHKTAEAEIRKLQGEHRIETKRPENFTASAPIPPSLGQVMANVSLESLLED